MKDGVRIINAARGDLVDEGALVEALESVLRGHLFALQGRSRPSRRLANAEPQTLDLLLIVRDVGFEPRPLVLGLALRPWLGRQALGLVQQRGRGVGRIERALEEAQHRLLILTREERQKAMDEEFGRGSVADPSIVRAFYDESEPLEGRTMLLELRFWRLRWSSLSLDSYRPRSCHR